MAEVRPGFAFTRRCGHAVWRVGGRKREESVTGSRAVEDVDQGGGDLYQRVCLCKQREQQSRTRRLKVSCDPM